MPVNGQKTHHHIQNSENQQNPPPKKSQKTTAMKRAALLLMMLSAPLPALTEYPTVEAALSAVNKDGRCIMLNFTGTDWCTACIHLKKRILDSAEFNNAMDKKLVLVEVDYPRTPELANKISAEEWKRREALLTRYRAEGLPYAVLLDSQGFPFATLSGTTHTAQDYLLRIDLAFSTLTARDCALRKAETLTGMDRARALAAALNLLPAVCREQYREIVREIVETDANDTLGYRQYLTGSEARIHQMNKLNELLDAFRGRHSPEQLQQQLSLLDAFLSTPNLDPDVRQAALRTKADTYAFLRDIPNMLKWMKEAHAVNPESRLGKKLEKNIQYTETQLLPMMQQSNKNNTSKGNN